MSHFIQSARPLIDAVGGGAGDEHSPPPAFHFLTSVGREERFCFFVFFGLTPQNATRLFFSFFFPFTPCLGAFKTKPLAPAEENLT